MLNVHAYSNLIETVLKTFWETLWKDIQARTKSLDNCDKMTRTKTKTYTKPTFVILALKSKISFKLHFPQCLPRPCLTYRSTESGSTDTSSTRTRTWTASATWSHCSLTGRGKYLEGSTLNTMRLFFYGTEYCCYFYKAVDWSDVDVAAVG